MVMTKQILVVTATEGQQDEDCSFNFVVISKLNLELKFKEATTLNLQRATNFGCLHVNNNAVKQAVLSLEMGSR